MYKCLSCGHLFEEGEQKLRRNYGEAWGAEFSTTEEVCPICGGVFEEAHTCPICNYHYIFVGEQICEECYKENLNLPTIAKFYAETDDINILIGELEEYGGKFYEELVLRAIDGKLVSDKTLTALALAWEQRTSNLDDFKEWLGR